MLDDFQEVARYDLSNRLVPSVRTYGCKLALCLLPLPSSFSGFFPKQFRWLQIRSRKQKRLTNI